MDMKKRKTTEIETNTHSTGSQVDNLNSDLVAISLTNQLLRITQSTELARERAERSQGQEGNDLHRFGSGCLGIP